MHLEILPAHRKKEIGPLRQAARGQKGIIRHHRMTADDVKNHFHQSRKRGKMDQILHQEGKGMIRHQDLQLPEIIMMTKDIEGIEVTAMAKMTGIKNTNRKNPM